MIVKILGVADMLAVLSLLLASVIPQVIIIIMALYLIIKGLIFTIIGNIPSFIDLIIGFYIIAVSFGISHWIITLIVVVYIVQKAVISVFS